MRVRCTEECFIRGVLHQPGDEFDWPGQLEDYMIPLGPVAESQEQQEAESGKKPGRRKKTEETE